MDAATPAPTALPEIVVKPPVEGGLPNFDAMPDESHQLPNFDAMPDESQHHPGLIEGAYKPITDIPSTYMQMVKGAEEQMGRGVEQLGTGQPWEMAKGAGNLALGGLGYVGAPISAPLHTIIGVPIGEVTRTPWLGNAAEIAASLMLPVPKGIPRTAAAMPEEAPFGVTLSAGERANDLAMRQAEQNALRGRPAEANSQLQAWVDQRQAQLETAKTGISKNLDPFGQEIAENPQQTGAVVSGSMQRAAASAKATANAAYQQAKAYPGEIDASAFTGMGNDIKNDLTARANPVIIDDKLTPFASQAIQDIDNRVAQLQIQNRASPLGQPNPAEIVGVNLEGVDQMRKRISAFVKGAFSSGNATDGRAAQAVLDAFDSRVDQAINGGKFKGDPRAILAWQDARAAYRDYRGTFTSAKNDPVGRVVEKIIGRNAAGQLPAGPAIPNDVADYLYGAQGVNPSSLNVGVANRVKDILGEQSPEWSGVKQGLFRRLVEKPQGVEDWGTGQIANRLNKFLNGDGTELAGTVYSPPERQMLQSYADLMRRITMPPGSYFPSGPSFGKVMMTVGNRVAAVTGALIGRAMVPGMPLVGELAGLTVGSQAEKAVVRAAQMRVAKQLPIVTQQWEKWSKAQSAAAAGPGNPALQKAAVAATAELQQALKPLGLENITAQGPGTANASPDQQPVPRPPGQ